MYTVYAHVHEHSEWHPVGGRNESKQWLKCLHVSSVEPLSRQKIFAFCDGVKLEHNVHVLLNKIVTNKGCVHTS